VSGRGILSLSCGQYHSVAATTEAGLLCFGKNDYGQCGLQDTGPRLLPGPVASPLTSVPVVQTACGYYHTTVLSAAGSLWAFGRNDFGQLGIGSRENAWRPQEVKGLLSRKIVQVAAGCYHTLALDEQGYAYAAGRNNHSQLGREKGKQADSPKFLRVAGLQDRFITSLAAGFYHSLVITVKREGEGPLGSARGLAADLLQLLDNERQSDVRCVLSQPVVGV
jgi:alpha-tubulin suppressor-like RCC1 family protein